MKTWTVVALAVAVGLAILAAVSPLLSSEHDKAIKAPSVVTGTAGAQPNPPAIPIEEQTAPKLPGVSQGVTSQLTVQLDALALALTGLRAYVDAQVAQPSGRALLAVEYPSASAPALASLKDAVLKMVSDEIGSAFPALLIDRTSALGSPSPQDWKRLGATLKASYAMQVEVRIGGMACNERAADDREFEYCASANIIFRMFDLATGYDVDSFITTETARGIVRLDGAQHGTDLQVRSVARCGAPREPKTLFRWQDSRIDDVQWIDGNSLAVLVTYRWATEMPISRVFVVQATTGTSQLLLELESDAAVRAMAVLDGQIYTISGSGSLRRVDPRTGHTAVILGGERTRDASRVSGTLWQGRSGILVERRSRGSDDPLGVCLVDLATGTVYDSAEWSSHVRAMRSCVEKMLSLGPTQCYFDDFWISSDGSACYASASWLVGQTDWYQATVRFELGKLWGLALAGGDTQVDWDQTLAVLGTVGPCASYELVCSPEGSPFVVRTLEKVHGEYVTRAYVFPSSDALSGSYGRVYEAALSDDRLALAASADNGTELVFVGRSGPSPCCFLFPDSVSAMSWSPAGEHIAVATYTRSESTLWLAQPEP